MSNHPTYKETKWANLTVKEGKRYWDDGETEGRFLMMLAENFPVGTKVFIEVPCCPECNENFNYPDLRCVCGYDWKKAMKKL